MTWVKVCGLTTPAAVAAAVAAGADAVGFVIVPGTPRYVAPAAVAELGADLDLCRVLVTVNLTPEELLAAAAVAGVDGVQPAGAHGPEAAAAAAAAGYFVLRPIPVAGPVDLAAVPPDQVPLLDTSLPGRHGGTGRSFDWTLARGLGRRFVLAGGLGPDNVADAIRRVRPWGVDASSALESAPGVKDPQRIRRYVAAAGEADSARTTAPAETGEA